MRHLFMQVVLSLLQLSMGGLIEGSTSLLGVAAMDCVIPQLSGSSNAITTFISQRMFTNFSEYNCDFKNTVGAFFAGLPFGLVIKNSSWTTALYAVEAVGAIYILCMFYLYIKHYNSYMTITTKKQK